MMRKPLYLDIAQANKVELEAVALKIRCHGQADSFFPLRLISRVIVTGKVEWQTSALLACLEYGIPVAFRGRDGALVGHCLSDRSCQVTLESLLHASADSEEGDALYQQWRLQAENRWVRRMERAFQRTFQGSVAHSIMPQVENLLGQHLPCGFSLFSAQLQVPVASHVVEVLAAYGFSDNIQLPVSRRVHLSRDMEKLLMLEAYWLIAKGEYPQVFEGRGLRYSMVHFYESHQAYFEERIRIALNRLWRTLKHQEAD